MASIKEITVFSIGDSRKLTTWSNVPYFFTKSLEDRGIKVNRVNIEENAVLNKLYRYTVFAALKLLYRNSNHSYFRSRINNFLTQNKIKKALIQYPDAGLNICLSFSFNTSISGTTGAHNSVLFGDWTYLYYIQNLLKREPYWFERAAIKREKKNIQACKEVIGLFPLSAQFIQQHYSKTCHYLGNVINANYSLNKEKLMALKPTSNKMLFIGTKKYLEGALQLIEAFKITREKNNSCELHLIGLSENETGVSMAGLIQYGYLDKGIPAQNEQYYSLISEAKVIVNTSKNWGSFSAVTEAMYYYTPVITTAYEEFTQTYGTNIEFGYYMNGISTNELVTKLNTVLNCPPDNYKNMMIKAREAVKDFTWAAYCEKLLNTVI